MTTIMKKISKGVVLTGESSDISENLEGSLFHNSSTARIKSYIQGAVREVLTNSQSQVLTNKTIDVDFNTISNLQLNNLKAGVLSTSISNTSTDTEIPSAKAVYTSLSAQNEASEIAFTPITNVIGPKVQDAIGQVQSNLQLHTGASSNVHGLAVGSSVVGTTDNQTLTTKTINADSNTISNLEVDNLKSGVLNTSTTLSAASDTQIPSALAVKTYVDNNSGGGGGSGSSDYLIDQIIYKTSTAYTSSTGLIYKRVKNATSLTSFSSFMIDKGTPVTGNLTFDIKAGELPFEIASRFNGIVYAIEPLPDFSILVGGAFTTYNGKTVNRIVKLKSNGNIDSTFSIGTGFDNTVKAIKVLSDGSVLVGGSFNTYNTVNPALGLCKLSSTGVIDNTFTDNNTRQIAPAANVNDIVNDIKIRSNGKILVCGTFTTSGFPQVARGLIQLNSDGSLDTSFAVGNGGSANKMVIMSDESLFIVGDFTDWSTSASNGIVKLTPTGQIDSSFNAGIGFSAATWNVNSIDIHQGNIIVVGEFSSYNGVSTTDLVKIDASSGAKMTSTTFAALSSGGFARDVKVLSDDTIIIVGTFTTYNTIARRGIVKVLSDGSIDPSFTSPITGISYNVHCVSIQSDNKILIGGDFTITSVTGVNNARLLSNGTVDITFDTFVSIFDTLPSFNFASLANGDTLLGVIARPSIPAGGYIKIDITVIPSTYVGSFYITLY